MNKLLLSLSASIILILTTSSVLAVCNFNINKVNYTQGEPVLIWLNCTTAESNAWYYIQFYNSTTTLQFNLSGRVGQGTPLPAYISRDFYVLPNNASIGEWSANLSGVTLNLTSGNKRFNVTTNASAVSCNASIVYNFTAVFNITLNETTYNYTTIYNYTNPVNVTINQTTLNVTTNNTLVNINEIAAAVWNATTRNLTYYPTQTDMTNYSRISNLTNTDVWNYTNRTLTYYPEVIINTTNTTYAPVLVLNLTTNTTIQEVWVNITNTTYAPELVLNLTTNTTIQEVWVNITNTTYAPELILNLTINTTNTSVIINATDLTPVLNRLDEINTTTNNITGTVWNYPNRTLTYYPEPVINLTNTTIIINTTNITVTVNPTDLTPVLARMDAMNETQTNIWNLLSGGISTTLTNILDLTTNINTTVTTLNPIVSINATFNVTNTLTPDQFAYAVWNYNQQINQNIIQQLTNFDSVYAPNKNDAWSDQTR